jgi:cytoskeletal protein RodZ
VDPQAIDIGLRLRQAREARGLSLRDIAATTKISMSALKAIEENNLSKLPGGLFRRAYLKAFAIEVGLNGDEIVREFRQQFEPEAPAPAVAAVGERRSHLILSLSVSATAAALVLSGAFVLRSLEFHQIRQDLRDQNMPVSDTSEALAASSAPDDSSDIVTNVALTEPTALPLRIEIRLIGECWVSASADGQRVLHRLMQAGERTQIEASEAIYLRIGDAGALEYSINGRPGRRLGSNGEVVTLQVTRDNLDLYVAPAAAEPPDGSPDVTRQTDPVRHIHTTHRAA